MKKQLLAGVLMLAGSFNVSAAGLDLALSDDTAYLSLLLNPFVSYSGGECQTSNPSQNCDGGTELALGVMTTEVGDRLLQASLMARSARVSGDSFYDIAAGIKAIGGEIDYTERLDSPAIRDETVGALALGMQIGTILFRSPNNPVDMSASIFYAPSITSFAKADHYLEYGAQIQIEVIPSARAYLGYRHLEFQTDGYSDVEVDSNMHIGLRISF